MTSNVTPFPNLFFTDQNRKAFVINGKGGKLLNTPASGGKDNVATFDLHTSFFKETGHVTMVFNAFGAQSDALKLIFKQFNQEEREQYLSKLIKSFIENAVIDSIEISDIQNPEKSFNASIKYHIDSIWKVGQPMFSFGSHASIPLTFLANADDRAFPINRHNDIVSPYVYTTKGTEQYTPPIADFLPLAIPPNDSLTNEFFSFKKVFEKEGNTINVKWNLVYKEASFSKEKYGLFLGDLRSLKEKSTWQINYFEPFNFCNKILRTENPLDLLVFCTNTLTTDSTNVLILLLRGLVYHQLSREKDSYNDFTQILKYSPNNKYAHLWIAQPLQALYRKDAALAQINEAIRIDPEFDAAYLARGRYNMDHELYEISLADFDRVVAINPMNKNGWRYKGFALQKLGRFKESIDSYLKAVSNDSTNAWLYSEIAYVYKNMGLYKKAIDYYHEAIRINPSVSSFYGNLGWSYYLDDNDQKCIEYSAKAFALDTTSYYSRFNIALANLRSGNISESRKIYKDLHNIKPPISEFEINGAVKDLNDLKNKGIYAEEISSILKDFFGQ